MAQCRRCGARVDETAAWCPTCFARDPLLDPEGLLDELNESLRPAPRWLLREPGRPSPPRVYSRWEAGPLSFGRNGRIALTVLAALLLAVWFAGPSLVPGTVPRDLFHASPLTAGAIFKLSIGAPLAVISFRWIWRKERVR